MSLYKMKVVSDPLEEWMQRTQRQLSYVAHVEYVGLLNNSMDTVMCGTCDTLSSS